MKFTLLPIFFLIFSITVNSQDTNIALVAKDACECLDDVNQSLERTEMIEEIKKCVEGAIISKQMMDQFSGLAEKLKDTISVEAQMVDNDSTTTPKEINIMIYTDLNFKEVEEYLLRNCDRMNLLLSTENSQRENSVSDVEGAIVLYQEGMQVYKKKDFRMAIKLYKKALKKDKNFAYAYDMIGISYRRLDEYNKALKYYNKSLKVDPQGRMPLLNIPIVYEKLGDYDKGIDAYKKFQDIYPDDPEGYYGIARHYSFKKDYEKALDNMMKAFVMYNEIDSPYARDAEANIEGFYKIFKEMDKLQYFKNVAEKYNIKIDD